MANPPLARYDPGLPGTAWPATAASEVFGTRAAIIPSRARAIFDDSRSIIIGWQWDTPDGWIITAAPDGTVISRSEKGLESPVIDPIDLLVLFGGLLRILGKGAAVGGVRLLESRAASRLFASQLSEREAGLLVGRMAAVDRMPLLFTRTVLDHMRDPDRFVPIQIIKLAIAYGSRSTDPRGVAGLVRYFIPMIRNGKEYGLEIILREKDHTVMHVLYRPGLSR